MLSFLPPFLLFTRLITGSCCGLPQFYNFNIKSSSESANSEMAEGVVEAKTYHIRPNTKKSDQDRYIISYAMGPYYIETGELNLPNLKFDNLDLHLSEVNKGGKVLVFKTSVDGEVVLTNAEEDTIEE